MGEDEVTARAKLVLDCIKRNQVTEVKPRDVVIKGWGGCRKADEARGCLVKLAEHNYLRPVERERIGDVGARPKDCYEVNPAIMLVMLVLLGGVDGEKSEFAA